MRMIFIRIRDAAAAMEAPTMPSGGIRRILRTTFKIAADSVVPVRKWGCPRAINVVALGPSRLLIIKPRDRILKAEAAGI